MNIQEKYILRSLEIAKKGIGLCAPNPAVGAVIVYDNKIIGEGFTSPFGGPHAEVNAINEVKDKSLLKQSTLYVTLEPCAHQGKTPPCANLIVKYQIPKVIIGCIDPNPKVAGKGIKILKDNGCDVTTNVLEKECLMHHKRFFTFQNKKRPYIILKWAQCSNGFIAPLSKSQQQPFWISNKLSQQYVHKWRTEEQSILIGYKTALEDNPELSARHYFGKNPVRFVIDNQNRLDKKMRVFNNASLTYSLKSNSTKSVYDIVNQLYHKNMSSVIIEGGAKTLNSFIHENLWDEARVFIGKIKLIKGVKCPEMTTKKFEEKKYLNDKLNIFYND